MRRVAAFLLSALLLTGLLLTGLAAPAAAQDGAAVFHRAEGLTAHLGRPGGPVLPQGTLTCAGCHGLDGGGGTEGGLSPAPAIGWRVLTKPVPERPAYDDAAFARLVTTGITPAGREISGRMPRFQGSSAVLAALTHYLRTLDQAEQQGLTVDSIAATLPADPDLRPAALAAIAVFNAEGGAFGRRVVVAEPAFLDLEALLQQILPRLAQAEEARLQALLGADPGLYSATDLPAIAASGPVRVAGTLDQIGPQLADLLRRPETQAIVVGPSSEAMSWAVKNRQSGPAAQAYCATRAVLALLRAYGRQPTRTRLAEDTAQIELVELVEVYRQPQNTR